MEQNVFYQEEESMSKLDIIVGVGVTLCCIAWIAVMFL